MVNMDVDIHKDHLTIENNVTLIDLTTTTSEDEQHLPNDIDSPNDQLSSVGKENFTKKSSNKKNIYKIENTNNNFSSFSNNIFISSHLFNAFYSGDFNELSKFLPHHLLPLLPALVRSTLTPSVTLKNNDTLSTERKRLLSLILELHEVSTISELLITVDYTMLSKKIENEFRLRSKPNTKSTDTFLTSTVSSITTNEPVNMEQDQNFIALFEQGEAVDKVIAVSREIILVMSKLRIFHEENITVKQQRSNSSQLSRNFSLNLNSSEQIYHKSVLFTTKIYSLDILYVLSVIHTELSYLLPLNELIETLIYFEKGIDFALCLIANFPNSSTDVAEYIIKKSTSISIDSFGEYLRCFFLRRLCLMHDSISFTKDVISKCIMYERLPSALVVLTLENLAHDVEESTDSHLIECQLFNELHNILILGSDKTKKWFSSFLKQTIRNPTEPDISAVKQLMNFLVNRALMMAEDFQKCGNEISERQILRCESLILLFVILKGAGGLRLTDKECNALLELILSIRSEMLLFGETACFQKQSVASKFLTTCLAALLGCCFGVMTTSENELHVISWIQQLIASNQSTTSDELITQEHQETLLLIAIHYHGGHLTPIVDLITDILKVYGVVKSSNLARLKNLFVEKIFTEQSTAIQASRVPPTKQLSSISGSKYLPIHCIHHLIKNRTFAKFFIEISDWIFEQLNECVPPLHPHCVPLIDTFVNSTILTSNRVTQLNKPISEECLSNFFTEMKTEDDNEKSSPSLRNHLTSSMRQGLFLYYILRHNDTMIQASQSTASSGRVSRHPFLFSSKLLRKIPIKKLLHNLYKRQELFRDLFAFLLNLVTTYFPHLCMTIDWLDESACNFEHEQTSQSTFSNSDDMAIDITVDHLDAAFQIALTDVEENAHFLSNLLHEIASFPILKLQSFTDVICRYLGDVVDTETMPRTILQMINYVWMRLNTILAGDFHVKSFNSLKMETTAICTEEDLLRDPLILFKCRKKVFRSTLMLEVLLRMLSAFLLASRTQVLNPLTIRTTVTSQGGLHSSSIEQDRNELKKTLLVSQDSAVVQLLLEMCLAVDEAERSDPALMMNLNEIQMMICSYIHQMFINDRDGRLIKLIHFQGYPHQLLDLCVKAIPSMHVCFNFIPELLRQPQLEKHIFGVNLLSHLYQSYPIIKAFPIVRLAVDMQFTMIVALPSRIHSLYFGPMLSAYVQLAVTFPPLIEDLIRLLVQLASINNSLLTSQDYQVSFGSGTNSNNEMTIDNNSLLKTDSIRTSNINEVNQLEPLVYVNYSNLEKLSRLRTFKKQLKIAFDHIVRKGIALNKFMLP